MVSNIFYFHPYLGKIPILTNIFQMGWNHQPVVVEGSRMDFSCKKGQGTSRASRWVHRYLRTLHASEGIPLTARRAEITKRDTPRSFWMQKWHSKPKVIGLYWPGTQMTLLLVRKRPCFEGLTFKHRDSFGFQVHLCLTKVLLCLIPPKRKTKKENQIQFLSSYYVFLPSSCPMSGRPRRI